MACCHPRITFWARNHGRIRNGGDALQSCKTRKIRTVIDTLPLRIPSECRVERHESHEA